MNPNNTKHKAVCTTRVQRKNNDDQKKTLSEKDIREATGSLGGATKMVAFGQRLER